ncbi:MAG TPA: hypothetical protein VMW50_10320 [Dehalococcoidia bacterium]|nr:hypothetical protein [Dehalococcoidia bacterium]
MRLWQLNKRIIDFRHSRFDVDEEIAKINIGLKTAKAEKKAELEERRKVLLAEKEKQMITADYKLTQKNYIDYLGVKTSRPPYFFSWCRYEELDNYRDLKMWKHEKGFVPVMVGDGFAPEGVEPEGGKYFYGDLIFVRRPLDRQLSERLMEIKLAKNAVSDRFKKFQSDMKAEGAEVRDEDLADLKAGLS